MRAFPNVALLKHGCRSSYEMLVIFSVVGQSHSHVGLLMHGDSAPCRSLVHDRGFPAHGLVHVLVQALLAFDPCVIRTSFGWSHRGAGVAHSDGNTVWSIADATDSRDRRWGRLKRIY